MLWPLVQLLRHIFENRGREFGPIALGHVVASSLDNPGALPPPGIGLHIGLTIYADSRPGPRGEQQQGPDLSGRRTQGHSSNCPVREQESVRRMV